MDSISSSKSDIFANFKPLSAVIVLHNNPRSTLFLNVLNHVSNVSFTSPERAKGQRKATYNLLFHSIKEINTSSVLSFAPQTVSISQ